jgi:hypothetical protein
MNSTLSQEIKDIQNEVEFKEYDDGFEVIHKIPDTEKVDLLLAENKQLKTWLSCVIGYAF